MSLAPEATLRSKIVDVIKAATASTKVYPLYKRAFSGRLEEFVELYGEEKLINTWMVRRAQRKPVIDLNNRLTGVIHTYNILGHYSINQDDDSENTFQLLIETLADQLELEENKTFGLSAVTHRGLEVPVDITDTMLGDWRVHTVQARLIVDVFEC